MGPHSPAKCHVQGGEQRSSKAFVRVVTLRKPPCKASRLAHSSVELAGMYGGSTWPRLDPLHSFGPSIPIPRPRSYVSWTSYGVGGMLCSIVRTSSRYCPLDNITPVGLGHLADFNYVQLSRRGRYSALSMLPCVGPMYYHKVAVEHMLHFGIACWEHIKW